MTEYGTIVADPPWPYKNPGEFTTGETPVARGAGSVARYGGVSMDVLKGLVIPTATDAHAYIWTTNAFVPAAYELAEAWGFRPITLLTWVKTRHDDPEEVSYRSGYYFRGATEHVLFAAKGKAIPLDTATPLPTAFHWPRTPHSVKPEAFMDMVERISPGPHLELFARRNRLGWDTWGDECLEHAHI